MANDWTINDLKTYLYTCALNESFNPIKTNAFSMIKSLIDAGKGDEIMKEVSSYANKNVSFTLSSIEACTYVLASCVVCRKSESLTNAAYTALRDISETPIYIFSFVYYHKHLLEQQRKDLDETAAKKFGKGWGKGQRKALIKWYNGRNEEDLLRLVTKYRHSHTWSHKDVIRMARIKPVNNGIALVFKYLLFGHEKVKNEKPAESEKALSEFMEDYENLKIAQTGADAAVLIRKRKFHLEHLPTKLQRHKEIWEALVEDMTLQQFCNYVGVITSKKLLRSGQPAEKHVLEKILNKESVQLSRIHPIQPCLAIQIYTQINELILAEPQTDQEQQQQQQQQTDQEQQQQQQQQNSNDSVKDALTEAFHISLNSANFKPSNKRFVCAVEINSFMRNAQTDGLKMLNPIDTSAAIILTLYYTENSCDLFSINDKLNKIDLPEKANKPDLNTMENIFQNYPSVEKNPNESLFNWAIENKQSYDAFIFLTASNIDENKLDTAIGDYRKAMNLPNSKLVIVSLNGRIHQPIATANSSNLKLIMKGWNIDSYFVLQSYLNDVF